MTFSKRNFAAACLLLGTSGLLISCNPPKSTDSPTDPSVETAGCITDGLEDSEVPISDQKKSSGPKTAEIDTADCIKDGL